MASEQLNNRELYGERVKVEKARKAFMFTQPSEDISSVKYCPRVWGHEFARSIGLNTH